MHDRLREFLVRQFQIFGFELSWVDSDVGNGAMPPDVSVHVFWNLNDVYDNNLQFRGAPRDFESQVRRFAGLLKKFRCPIITLGADAARWGLSTSFNTIRDDVRGWLREEGILVKCGVDFWNDLAPIATKCSGMHHQEGSLNPYAMDFLFDK